MADIVIFAGTTEGREIAEKLARKGVDALVCVAGEYGKTIMNGCSLRINAGRLGAEETGRLLQTENPRAVIDATHPYAASASENIKRACTGTGVKLLRVIRERLCTDGCAAFSDLNRLVQWLNEHSGVIFCTLGTKNLSVLSGIRDKSRVYHRILPDLTALSACVRAGFRQNRIICMQGPFSRQLNAAMFRETGAKILVTKESGQTGGFAEKTAAAKDCSMTTAVLLRPVNDCGVTLAEILKLAEKGEL